MPAKSLQRQGRRLTLHGLNMGAEMVTTASHAIGRAIGHALLYINFLTVREALPRIPDCSN